MRTMMTRILLVLIACASTTTAAEVKSDYDRDFDLSKLRSFRFSDHGRNSSKDALAADEISAKKLRSAIQSNLIALGMQPQVSGADFEVFYFATLRN